MEPASKLSALAQPFGVGVAIKFWSRLFNSFLEANQIGFVHALAFSDIDTSRELLRRQLQLTTSSRSATLASDREVNKIITNTYIIKYYVPSREKFLLNLN